MEENFPRGGNLPSVRQKRKFIEDDDEEEVVVNDTVQTKDTKEKVCAVLFSVSIIVTSRIQYIVFIYALSVHAE